jgi:hypothetical protein
MAYGAMALSVCCTSPASAFGQMWRMVDKEVQVAGFGFRPMPDGSGEQVCLVYIGWSDLYKDGTSPTMQALVNLADQAFEEGVGTQCRVAYGGKKATTVRPVENARLFVGDQILYVENRYEFTDELARATGFHVDYRRITDVGKDFDLLDGEPPRQLTDAEFKRVSQPDIPVEPSHREPNLVAIPTEIAPGISVGFENKWVITFTGERKPTLLVQYQTDVSIGDVSASQALAAQVAGFYGKDALASRKVNSIRVGAYNEPRRSRFHFRPFYDYAVDSRGKVLDSTSDLVGPESERRPFGGAPLDRLLLKD